jgi:hypothetical protein
MGESLLVIKGLSEVQYHLDVSWQEEHNEVEFQFLFKSILLTWKVV